jgi:hypothetical protein
MNDVQWSDLRKLPARVCTASRKAYLLDDASQFELMVQEVLGDPNHVLQPKAPLNPPRPAPAGEAAQVSGNLALRSWPDVWLVLTKVNAFLL